MQRRLVAILKHCITAHPRHFERQVKLPRLSLPSTLSVAILQSPHVPVIASKGMSCLACLSGCDGLWQHQLAWLRTDCVPRYVRQAGAFDVLPAPIPPDLTVWLNGVEVHSSHRLWLYRGLFMCVLCGAQGSTKLRALVRPCSDPPLASGPRAIARFKAGELPWGLTHWPDAPTALQPGKAAAFVL